MTLFAIICPVRLFEKPDWLEGFCLKYRAAKEVHVTLIQPRVVEEVLMDEVRRTFEEFVQYVDLAARPLEILFQDLTFGREVDGTVTIMLEAKNCPEIHLLQKEVRETFAVYQNYSNPESKEWEENFKPHLTLAPDLSVKDFEQAERELKEGLVCKGVIREIKLVVVPRIS